MAAEERVKQPRVKKRLSCIRSEDNEGADLARELLISVSVFTECALSQEARLGR